MNKRRLGRCYELAGWEMVDTDRLNVRLVHGIVGYKEMNPHAWLEYDETFRWPDGSEWVERVAWEPVSKVALPVDAFYHIFQAEPKHWYDWGETRKWMLKAQNWGPWEGDYWRTERQGRKRQIKRKGSK